MAPSISALSGTVATGNNLTITCTGAGTKARSKPFMYANWQEGTLNPHTTLSFTSAFTSTQNRILTNSSTFKRWGAGYVAEASWPRDGTGGGSSSVLECDVTTMAASAKMRCFAWRRWVNGDSSGNYKWWRFWPSAGAGNYPDAYIGDSLIEDTGNRGWFLENGTPVTGTNRTYFTYPVPSATWQFDDILLKLNSTPGTADGTLIVNVNNSELTNDTTFAFDFSGIVGPIRKVDLQDTKASSLPGATMRAFIDTFYIDDSWSIVFIGDNSTFSSCTQLEVQPFTSWSDTSITINCQLGSFASASGKYLFLVDNSNAVTSGFALSGAAGAPAPSITSLSVTSGPTAGGTTTVATGANFVATPTVKVNAVSATGVVMNSSSSLTFVTPAGTAGAKDVVVTNPDAQTGTLTNGFTYVAAPTVTSCSPTAGSQGGGVTLTLTGTGFSGVTGVTIGGTACTSVATVNSTTVTCVNPAKVAGVYNIVVTNSDGQTGTLINGFTYSIPPIAPGVISCTPSSGSVAGGTSVVIAGTDFTPTGLSATFDGLAATSVAYVDANTLTCITPAHAAATVNIVVTNGYNLTGTLSNGFTYSSDVVSGRRRTLSVARNLV